MVQCHITRQQVAEEEAIQGKYLKREIFDLIQKDYPSFNESSYVGLPVLNKYRRLFFTQLIQQEKSEIQKLDESVLQAIRDNAVLSESIKGDQVIKATFADKMADKIAGFGGSWTFIIIFFIILILWMIINVYFLSNKGFDPYPFILMNLILSCIAAVQAPVIMMSQNRQEQKDRLRAENDYKINLKAELEIQLLSEKIDYLLVHQNQKLLEVQEVQIDYLEDLDKRLNEYLSKK